jgi:hypothetical protein
MESELLSHRSPTPSRARSETPLYFSLTVLGFSFWFLMAVPFASHRETYWWLAKVSSEDIGYALSFISSTYRPLHQVTTWMAYQVLDPSVFPTSISRQMLLQFLVYVMFLFGWWLMFSRAAHRRVFALVACIVGGVFFSGYVHLFHVYGLSYVPVILMLGALLRFWAARTFRQHEVQCAMLALPLVLWHPFTTALFTGFYAGYLLDTFGQRTQKERVQSLAILAVSAGTVVFVVFGLPRLLPDTSALLVETATRSVDTRVLGFMVSYRTNEVNVIASFIAFALTQGVAVTLVSSLWSRLAVVSAALVVAVLFIWQGIPLILLWVLTVLVKLAATRNAPLLFLALTATVLPFGGGIGTPIHSLFAIIVATYVTALAWPKIDEALSVVKPRYITALILCFASVLSMSRAGLEVPFLTSVARPLLAERERTYQLERALAWLHQSEYCDYSLDFAAAAGNPVDSVESAIARRHRPPAAVSDVQLFWNSVLKCGGRGDRTGMAIITFGGPTQPDAKPVVKLDGRYAGAATVWIRSDAR